MKLNVILIALIAITGCSRHDPAQAVLSLAFPGCQPHSLREMRHHESGLREQVDELFFRVDPSELKEALSQAGFVRDDTIPVQIRSANSSFKDLIGSSARADAIGYRRADLTIYDGKCCHLLCASDFTWVYLVYVDYGNS
ncbi:MAG TPA: hypothetical protein PKM57_03345 [Kiritimatiellia bacterium]|nr:hypothetical protein [Kiritimatiellia bacterium]HPS09302.1 hypothetical protein [Kiritimatiellia bacterium]